MNFYELKPTNENVSKTLVEDSSKRRNLAVVRFIQLLNKINTSNRGVATDLHGREHRLVRHRPDEHRGY